MAELKEQRGTRRSVLWPEHLIGRGEQCALRLDGGYVSAQHAVIRWNGAEWELVDRGSRNGTHLNGELLQPKRAYPLARGALIAFGHAEERWSLEDDRPPEAMVVALDTGEVLSGASGVIAVPSKERVECTLLLGQQGRWQLEQADGSVIEIDDGYVFAQEGRRFRFCRASGIKATVSLSESKPARGVLTFKVARDEEFVELAMEYGSHRVPLGSRTHNYLLLLLARTRLRDTKADVPETSCGWVDKDELAEGLRMTSPQIDGEVYRIRRHFGHLGLQEAATIIERRAGTRQLRIGISRVRIERV